LPHHASLDLWSIDLFKLPKGRTLPGKNDRE